MNIYICPSCGKQAEVTSIDDGLSLLCWPCLSQFIDEVHPDMPFFEIEEMQMVTKLTPLRYRFELRSRDDFTVIEVVANTRVEADALSDDMLRRRYPDTWHRFTLSLNSPTINRTE